MSTPPDHLKKTTVFFTAVAVIVYSLWAGVGLIMPDFYYDQPIERLLLAFLGVVLIVYLSSPRAPSVSKSSLLLSFYVLLLHFHFLSLFIRAGGDEIYALGVLIFLIGASLLFLELRLYIGFFIIVIASYFPTFIALNLPSYRIVMLVAGILTIGVATSLLLFMRIRLSDQFHAHRMAIANLERQVFKERLSKQEEATQRYKNDAYYDSLTGLPNRKSFQDYLKRISDLACQKQRPFALLFADLDNFKEINDAHGHDAGDSLLRHFAERFKTALRSSDYPARYGGDEFVAILPEITTIKDAKPICERIIKVAADPYHLTPDIACNIGVSIGISFHPGNDDATSPLLLTSPQELLMYADRAMYEAKRRGKNRWVPYSKSVEN